MFFFRIQYCHTYVHVKLYLQSSSPWCQISNLFLKNSMCCTQTLTKNIFPIILNRTIILHYSSTPNPQFPKTHTHICCNHQLGYKRLKTLLPVNQISNMLNHVIWKIETFIEEDTRHKKHCTWTMMSQSASKQAPCDLTQFSQSPSADQSYFS